MRIAIPLLCALSLVACETPPAAEYVYGVDLDDVTLNLYTGNMGIHPDTSVLQDPENPFALQGCPQGTNWVVNDGASNAGAFYCWATLLTAIPTGENQYYAALRLEDVYIDEEVPEGALDVVRLMAIRAYQSVLDNFPDSVTYSADGTFSYRLAPLAYDGILRLGGTPQGDWVVVTTPSGGTDVVPGGQTQ